mgnify:CR=1 FL=1
MDATERDQLDKILKFYEFALRVRDPYENGHARRVATLAVHLARNLGCDNDLLVEVKYGARLHDVGKIMLPVATLNKPVLTSEEFAEVKEHVTNGSKIFETLNINGGILCCIAESHENWNGTGYPNGKRGSEICYGARIVRICDSYDAMTNDRPYGKKFTSFLALEEMEKWSLFYDPEILKVFVEMIKAT